MTKSKNVGRGGSRIGAGRPPSGSLPTGSLTARHQLLLDLLSATAGGTSASARESNRKLVMAAIILGGSTTMIADRLEMTEGALLDGFGPEIASAVHLIGQK